MDTRNLQYFMAVYEHLHFTRAAEALGISQPTLSQQIRILEAEFGMPLFDRIGKKVIATEAGHLLRQYGMNMLQTEQDVKMAIKELASGQQGTVRLAVLPSDLDFQLVPLFVQFKSIYPRIRLQAISTIFVQDEVLNYKVDIGIGLTVPPDPRLVQIPLGSEPYRLFVHEHSELAHRESITLQELREHPLVMYPQGFIGRDLVDKVCRQEGFELSTIMETSSASSLLQLVSAGIGATIQPESLLRKRTEFPHITSIPIEGATPVRQLQLMYYADRFVSRSQQQLTKWLIDFFK